MAKWFVTIEGREYGPLSAAELKRAVAKGRVTAETPVRMEGMDSRVPAARVKDLFAAAKDKTAEITPPLKKEETGKTSDDSEELKVAETNWSPPVATPSDDPQQPPAFKAKQKKQPAMQLHRSWWVTAVAIVHLLLGSFIIVIVTGALLEFPLFKGPNHPINPNNKEIEFVVHSLSNVFELFLNVAVMVYLAIIVVLGVLVLLAGYGLIKRRQWGRILSLVLAVLSGLLVAMFIKSFDPRLLGQTLFYGLYSVFNFVILLNPRFAAEFE